ncbi:MAG: hypothetical protein ACI85K_003105 [Hyphomicrobiaceae bacterium]|jgi:hypothetical protein
MDWSSDAIGAPSGVFFKNLFGASIAGDNDTINLGS